MRSLILEGLLNQAYKFCLSKVFICYGCYFPRCIALQNFYYPICGDYKITSYTINITKCLQEQNNTFCNIVS